MKTWFVIIIGLCLFACGCTTKKKARVNAQAAFQAGQQQALSNLAEARRINIRFVGPVRNQEVVWSAGLTLAQAIAAAEYFDARDPNVVIIIRQRERLNISTRDLLRGEDWALEPGDTVEIHP